MFSTHRSDIEVLCDTLISLTDRYEKWIEKTKGEFPSPHIAAMDAIVLLLEQKAMPHRVQNKIESDTITRVANTFSDMENASVAKPERKKPSRKKQPQIQVIHGASDDPKEHSRPINDAGYITEEVSDKEYKRLEKSENPQTHKPTNPQISPVRQTVKDILGKQQEGITYEAKPGFVELPQRKPAKPYIPSDIHISDKEITADNIDQVGEALLDQFENDSQPEIEPVKKTNQIAT